MKNPVRKVGNAIINGTCVVLGALHFVSDTTSDVLLHAEAKLRHRRYGEDVQEVKNERVLKTCKSQQHILDKMEAFNNSVKEARARFNGQVDESQSVVTCTSLILVPMEEAMTQ